MNKKGILLLGNRDTGKTTQLYLIYNKAYKEGKRILVIDSATEHKEKSLLNKIVKKNDANQILIYSCDKDEIVFPKIHENIYPSNCISKKLGQVYLCDAAYYLERGYIYPAGKLRDQERLLYKKFSMQVIYVLLDKVDVIIMDEIELIPEGRFIIEEIYRKKIELYMSLHHESGLCNMKDLFQIERLIG